MAETEEQPLVTFVLFAYNQERYIAEAVAGALAQDYSPLKIILSDDCSTDLTFEIMQRMAAEYQGPHKIVLNRNERNLGISGHVNAVMELVRTQFVILAAGDDISLPSRTSVSVVGLTKSGSPMISLSTISFFPDGQSRADNTRTCTEIVTLKGYLKKQNKHPAGASRAMDIKLFSLFGPLHTDCPTEDTTFLMRALLLGDVHYLPEVGVRYRRHPQAVSRPENVLKMKTERIGDQYLVDAARAKELGLISDQTHLDVESMIRVFNKRRAKAENLRRSRRLMQGLLPIIIDFDFSIREKLSSIKYYLLSRFAGSRV